VDIYSVDRKARKI